MVPRAPGGFTLIELLVVITVIAVLLALLMPALDQALYQADLAVCGSRQHVAAFGQTMYATDYRRYYAPRTVSAAGPAEVIYAKVGALGVNQFLLDDRVPYKGYIDLSKTLSDPALPALNITDDPEATPSGTNWLIYTPINLWTGYFHKDGKPMRKIGDRMTYVGGTSPNLEPPLDFNVVAGDTLLTSGPDPRVWGRASHPDKDGRRRVKWMQDGPYTQSAQGQTIDTSRTQTFAQWIGPATSALDVNFAFQDGSVRRYNDVQYGDNPPGQPYPRDPRMQKIKFWGDKGEGTGVTDFIQLPKEQ